MFRASTVDASNKRGGYDVVFSNPPYQIADGGHGASARPVYHEIVMHAIDYLNPQYVCMITPSRWMAGGKGLNEYRVRMLADTHIKSIIDFQATNEVFKDVDVTGGVSYFLWSKSYSGICDFNGSSRDLDEFDVLVRDNTSCQILRKVLAETSTFCNTRVLPLKPFGLPSNFNDWVTEGVKCFCPLRAGFTKYVDSTSFSDLHQVLGMWKVFTPRAGWDGNAYQGGVRTVISQIFVGEPETVCIETYLVAGSFNTKIEAENYAAYMRTKFFRFMLSLRVISQNISREKFSWVPDFGNYSHVYTDKDLYQHFGLTKKEIEHIEKSIKAIK